MFKKAVINYELVMKNVSENELDDCNARTLHVSLGIAVVSSYKIQYVWNCALIIIFLLQYCLLSWVL